jgi:hypothetical protein
MAIDVQPGTVAFDEFVDEAERLHLRVTRPGPSVEPPTIVPYLWKWPAIERMLPQLASFQDVGGSRGDTRRTAVR